MQSSQLRWIFRAWRYRLRLDPAEIRWLLKFIKPGDTVVDVGAHKGGYTYWMARAAGPAGQVIAFEPQQRLAAELRNQAAVLFPQVTVEAQGLSDHQGLLPLKLPGGLPSPGASFEDTATVSGAPCRDVPVTSLDRYFSGKAHSAVRLIKCDVEGHEVKVFKGAERILRQDRPALLFECEQRHAGANGVRAVFQYLSEMDYQGWYFDRIGPKPLSEFDPERHQNDPDGNNYHNNFLFQSRESMR